MKLARYVAATALAEALAQAVSALVTEAVMHSGSPESIAKVLLPSLVMMGAIEGALVGAAQAHVLRAHVPRGRFVLATTLAMTASWLVGALVSLFEPSVTPSPMLVIGMAAVLGCVVGGALGLAQDRVFAKAGIGTTSFIGYSALAWCSMQVFLAMVADVADAESVVARVLIRMCVGGFAGAIVGVIAGPSLVGAIEARG